tara:strand:- start:58 stop:234 length:177 start_codon:yes stop_codon:yes gene_type:complete
MNEKRKRLGKIVFVPAERCFANILIEETPHGYKLYRSDSPQHFTVIPHSMVRAIEYKN